MKWEEFSDLLKKAAEQHSKANIESENQILDIPNFLEYWIAKEAFNRGFEAANRLNLKLDSQKDSLNQRNSSLVLVSST